MTIHCRLASLVVCAILAAAAPLRAQEAPAPRDSGLTEYEKVRVRLIDFLAVDGKGRPVTDLRKDEIELWDDGERQVVLDLIPATGRFRPEAGGIILDRAEPEPEVTPSEPEPEPSGQAVAAAQAEPRWIIFLFDARNLSYQGRVRAGRAVQDLMTDSLRPEDRVSLMVDDHDLRVLVPFTRRHEDVVKQVSNPEGLSSTVRDIETRLRDLRDDTESCREDRARVDCARQAASNFVFETRQETETSLEHLTALLRSLAAIPDRKILFYISEGFLADPGDVATAAVEHAIGQFGHLVSETALFLQRDFRHHLDPIYELATRSRTGIYPVNTIRKMTDDLFSPERPMEGGPENLPQARTDPFEACWQQVRKQHTDMARSTGGKALFARDPQGRMNDQLQSADAVYTLTYAPTAFSWDKRKIKLKVRRRKVRLAYRDRYDSIAGDWRKILGELKLSQTEQDRANGLVRVRLEVSGEPFNPVEASVEPVPVASLFFELRNAANGLLHDLHEVIAVPLPKGGKPGSLVRPFALAVRPGSYSLRVDVSDLNGAARGSFYRGFTVGGQLQLLEEADNGSQSRVDQ